MFRWRREIEFAFPAGGEIDEVERVLFARSSRRSCRASRCRRVVGVRHLLERDLLVAEEVERDAAVVPALVAAAEVLADEVVLRELVAEVVLDARAARQERAPEAYLRMSSRCSGR